MTSSRGVAHRLQRHTACRDPPEPPPHFLLRPTLFRLTHPDIKVKHNTDGTKFKLRLSKYLYTLNVKDTAKAAQLSKTLPPGAFSTRERGASAKSASSFVMLSSPPFPCALPRADPPPRPPAPAPPHHPRRPQGHRDRRRQEGRQEVQVNDLGPLLLRLLDGRVTECRVWYYVVSTS